MKKSILVVDDDKGILTLLRFILEQHYTVTLAENGITALQKLNETVKHPDLIICDLAMPYLNGNSFIRQVKISGFYRDIPVMVLSASESIEQQVKDMPFHIDGFLQKPFSPVVLQEMIKTIIDSSVTNKSSSS